MWNSTGKALQILGKVIFWIEAVASLITAIVLWVTLSQAWRSYSSYYYSYTHPMAGWIFPIGLAALVVGVGLAFVSSLFLVGFGKIVESSEVNIWRDRQASVTRTSSYNPTPAAPVYTTQFNTTPPAAAPAGPVSLGLSCHYLDQSDPFVAQNSLPSGIYVKKVFPGSPAAKAGLQEWDLLLSINGQPVYSIQDVASQVKGAEHGSTRHILVRRITMGENEVKSFQVTL